MKYWKLHCWNVDRRYTCTVTVAVQRAFPQSPKVATAAYVLIKRLSLRIVAVAVAVWFLNAEFL